jgi:hypothetical protein
MMPILVWVLPALIAVLALPTALGMIPPNRWYGLRTPKTLSSKSLTLIDAGIPGVTLLNGIELSDYKRKWNFIFQMLPDLPSCRKWALSPGLARDAIGAGVSAVWTAPVGYSHRIAA